MKKFSMTLYHSAELRRNDVILRLESIAAHVQVFYWIVEHDGVGDNLSYFPTQLALCDVQELEHFSFLNILGESLDWALVETVSADIQIL